MLSGISLAVFLRLQTFHEGWILSSAAEGSTYRQTGLPGIAPSYLQAHLSADRQILRASHENIGAGRMTAVIDQLIYVQR